MRDRPRPVRGCPAGAEAPLTTRPSRRLSAPRPAQVRPGCGGVPAAVGRTAVDSVREDWLVEDRRSTGDALRRRYFELVLVDGRNIVVFHDLMRGRWYLQRG